MPYKYNPFTRKLDLEGSQGLEATLSNGFTTGAYDISVDSGQVIKATSGGGQLNLRASADNAYELTSDNAAYGIGASWLYGITGNNTQLGYTINGSFESIGFICVKGGLTPTFGSAYSVIATDTTSTIGYSGTGDTRGVFVGTKSSTIASGSVNTVVASGDSIVATASNSLYANQFRLQLAANVHDGIYTLATLTAARTYTFGDRNLDFTTANAYTANATAVLDRTLLASASATAINNNNVLAALISDLQGNGIIS
tara:strand:+ start:218 stop:985 length:768 start_codon:yes stop_codon:yes gene_type:complete